MFEKDNSGSLSENRASAISRSQGGTSMSAESESLSETRAADGRGDMTPDNEWRMFSMMV